MTSTPLPPPSSLNLTTPSPGFNRSLSKTKHQVIDVLSEYQLRESEKKKVQINLVVVGKLPFAYPIFSSLVFNGLPGHVDAGKSTLMGHLLYLLGNVSKRIMHK